MKRIQNSFLWLVLLATGLLAADDVERKTVRHDEPEYPEIAAKMNLHGTVKLKIWIAPNGSVRRLDYLGGHPVLAQSALNAVKNWKYEMANKETTTVVELKF
jgi:TonB family protein